MSSPSAASISHASKPSARRRWPSWSATARSASSSLDPRQPGGQLLAVPVERRQVGGRGGRGGDELVAQRRQRVPWPTPSSSATTLRAAALGRIGRGRRLGAGRRDPFALGGRAHRSPWRAHDGSVCHDAPRRSPLTAVARARPPDREPARSSVDRRPLRRLGRLLARHRPLVGAPRRASGPRRRRAPRRDELLRRRPAPARARRAGAARARPTRRPRAGRAASTPVPGARLHRRRRGPRPSSAAARRRGACGGRSPPPRRLPSCRWQRRSCSCRATAVVALGEQVGLRRHVGELRRECRRTPAARRRAGRSTAWADARPTSNSPVAVAAACVASLEGGGRRREVLVDVVDAELVRPPAGTAGTARQRRADGRTPLPRPAAGARPTFPSAALARPRLPRRPLAAVRASPRRPRRRGSAGRRPTASSACRSSLAQPVVQLGDRRRSVGDGTRPTARRSRARSAATSSRSCSARAAGAAGPAPSRRCARRLQLGGGAPRARRRRGPRRAAP